MQVTIWHNPRCSKSREALRLLQERGIDPEIRRYLDDVPSVHELNSILDRLGITAHELVRRGEKEFRELGLDNGGTSEQQLIAAMAEHPRLIERPVVFSSRGAVIGRPPEKVSEVLP